MTKETFKSTEYVTTEKVIELPAIVRHDRSIYLSSEQDFNMAILSVINSVKEMADRHIFRNQ